MDSLHNGGDVEEVEQYVQAALPLFECAPQALAEVAPQLLQDMSVIRKSVGDCRTLGNFDRQECDIYEGFLIFCTILIGLAPAQQQLDLTEVESLLTTGYFSPPVVLQACHLLALKQASPSAQLLKHCALRLTQRLGKLQQFLVAYLATLTRDIPPIGQPAGGGKSGTDMGVSQLTASGDAVSKTMPEEAVAGAGEEAEHRLAAVAQGLNLRQDTAALIQSCRAGRLSILELLKALSVEPPSDGINGILTEVAALNAYSRVILNLKPDLPVQALGETEIELLEQHSSLCESVMNAVRDAPDRELSDLLLVVIAESLIAMAVASQQPVAKLGKAILNCFRHLPHDQVLVGRNLVNGLCPLYPYNTDIGCKIFELADVFKEPLTQWKQ
ncbi:hypothetical protein GNI_063160 [Gregarina niphandrodes]|uniref:Uncharacterized protein n=1 Tax=Gregarina niphandrodes TaxID=110365 RepID=A0A023B8A0_GRENI|nr:hypothetical protein GNI_063160 [Gregarina niphandrodes]EZG68224.1 hypothetical protein GNI_063160 [Gregarina niphandrodes]|eukprot:XP_011130026.1 hypothetical protein GNI_063160 [Gregarina niphandrodes]